MCDATDTRRYAADDRREVDLEAALRACRPRAVRTAYGMLGSMDAAQDVVQDACVAATRKRVALREPAAFDAWFLKIVVRRAYAASRKRRRPVPDVLLEPPAADRATVLDVRRALDALAPRLRAAVVLCHVLAYTSDEAGRLLGVPGSTVRNRLFRARPQLAAALADYAPQKGF